MNIEQAINIFENKFDNYAIGRMYTDLYPVKGIILAALRAQQERENPKPLTLEQLKERVGKTVWIIEGNQNHPAECEIHCVEIYRCDSRYVYFFYFGCATEEGLLIEHYGTTWLAYDHEPKEARYD